MRMSDETEDALRRAMKKRGRLLKWEDMRRSYAADHRAKNRLRQLRENGYISMQEYGRFYIEDKALQELEEMAEEQEDSSQRLDSFA